MTNTYKKKLIEVAIPLEAINAASAREKSIRHGHPSTLHLWWARRPLAACRAVLFAQLVDDPSGYADKLLEEDAIRAKAEAILPDRVAKWEAKQADAKAAALGLPRPTLEDCAAEIERDRLFAIIKDLVVWENSTNEEVLERARAEIRRSCGGVMPPIYDPFSGGGSIPLEAQRLGLPAYGSDLNPVAVMIGKAMIEIPPRFKDMNPIHPGAKERSFYRNTEGLAEDVKHYGEWIREQAQSRIGHLYPQAQMPKEYGGGKATAIAWLWTRTVPSPDPAFANAHVPIASSFLLSNKKSRETWIEPVVDRSTKTIRYRVRRGNTPADLEKAATGTKIGTGANFQCLLSGGAITADYIRNVGKSGKIGQSLIAIVVEGSNGRAYLDPDTSQEKCALDATPEWRPSAEFEPKALGFRIGNYGLKTWGDFFTGRQSLALNTFSDLVAKVHKRVLNDALNAFEGIDAQAYADAVTTYLAMVVGKCSDYWSSSCTWHTSGEKMRNTFGRQALPMVWDFAEANPFSDSSGNWNAMLTWVWKVVAMFQPNAKGVEVQADAQGVIYPHGAAISTDPPYYDNIGYADLSDFFYSWLKPLLKDIYPDLFGSLVTPKLEELVATPVRHGGKDAAERFFLGGMRTAIEGMARQSDPSLPTTIYYAFKQSEIAEEGISSTGWATFLQAVLDAGYSVVRTWPVRTELANRMRGIGSNALASSVVLVCRQRKKRAEVVSRAEFLRSLKRELPPALAELQSANIAPADMPQSAIGPGMGVFSRYKAVLESDDSPMSVKTALQLINKELDEYLGGIQGEFDADTRFAITWFEQHGMAKGEYGAANNIATARGISVESVKHAGIVESAAGSVRILKRDELAADWDPLSDTHLTVWECLQYLLRQHEKDGLSFNTALLLRKISDKAEAVKDLAYCLYDISANKRKDAKEATAYNALIADWSDLTREAAKIHDVRGDNQTAMDF